MEVGDHDHGADHDDPDQGGKQDERGGEGVEHLDKEETRIRRRMGIEAPGLMEEEVVRTRWEGGARPGAPAR